MNYTTTPSLEAQDIYNANMVKDVKIAAPHSATASALRDRTPPLSGAKYRTPAPYWPIIATKDDIPTWLRDNDYIIGGHPMPTYSCIRSLRLWRCLHMETMNIWTHLLGSAVFIGAGSVLYSRVSSSATLSLSTGDKFAFGISITAASLCFGLSATFHTLRSHSYKVHHFTGTLDILGICVLAVGGGMSATYYAFYCNPTTQQIYWALNASSALAAAYTLFDTGGGGSKMRTLRGGTFMLLALTAMLPIFHGSWNLGWARACIEIGTQWYLAEGMTLLVGVSMFVARFPERLSPGMFDIWGHSHQWHHICAVVGTGFHVAALGTGYMYRQLHASC